jgi:hypothetical protein
MSKQSRRRSGGKEAAGLVPGLKLYVVQRRSWRSGGEVFLREDDDGGVPVRAFTKRAHAKACRDDLERRARRELSPFWFLWGEVSERIEGGRRGLLRGLKALGVSPPPKETLKTDLIEQPWRDWWDSIAGTLTDEQRDGLWALLPHEGFYEVVRIELDTDEIPGKS